MGPGQKILTQVWSGKPFMIWVCILKIHPKNVNFFHFFSSSQKKISSGQVKNGDGP